MMMFMVLALMLYLAFSLAARCSEEALPEPGICAPLFRFVLHSSRPTTRVMDAQFTHLPEDPEPTVLLMMVEGQLYQSTGRESDRDGRCGMPDGQITDSVERNLTPSRDGQSNFGAPYGYQYGDNGELELCMDGRWLIFEPAQSPRVRPSAGK